jgi:hypothetical protein
MNGVPSSEGDAFTIAMLVVMLCGLGMVVMLLVTILRNASKRNSEVDDLIDEVEREEKKEKAPVGKTSEPWEKDGDWWKKE